MMILFSDDSVLLSIFKGNKAAVQIHEAGTFLIECSGFLVRIENQNAMIIIY